MFDLTGKIAIVTGASRGIGKSCKDILTKYGAIVYEFNQSQGHDLGNKKNIDIFFEKIQNLDILVNNAGVTNRNWDETLQINLTGTFNFCEAAKNKMKNGGSIINISSINSFLGFPNNPQYVVSKHGLNGLTKSLAIDYANLGIRVNAIAPGYIKTDMTSQSWEKRKELIEKHTIIGRWGLAEDIQGTLILLASDASSYITGQIITVDGGWTAKGLVNE